MVIDQLTEVKTKFDKIFQSVGILIDKSQYFVYVLFLLANKSQLTSSMRQDFSKTLYNNLRDLVNTTITFSLKKLFFDSSIFTNGKNFTMQYWLSNIQNKLKFNQEYYPDNDTQTCYIKNCCGGKALEY